MDSDVDPDSLQCSRKKKKILKVSCSWSPDQQQWISTSVSHNLKLPEAGPSLRHQQQNYRSSRTKSNQSNYDSASSARSTANSMVESVPLFRFGKSCGIGASPDSGLGSGKAATAKQAQSNISLEHLNVPIFQCLKVPGFLNMNYGSFPKIRAFSCPHVQGSNFNV